MASVVGQLFLDGGRFWLAFLGAVFFGRPFWLVFLGGVLLAPKTTRVAAKRLHVLKKIKAKKNLNFSVNLPLACCFFLF